MKKLTLLVLTLVCAASLLFNVVLYTKATTFPRLLAVSWGDSKYAPALYGAYVFYEPQGDQLQVKATIYIDRPSLWFSYEHDTLDLGRVRDATDAVAQWGQISWSAEGVRFGQSDHAVLVKTADLENHR